MKLNRVKYNNSLQLLFYFFSIFVLFLTENKRENFLLNFMSWALYRIETQYGKL